MTDKHSSDSDRRAQALRLDRLEAFFKTQPPESNDSNDISVRRLRLYTVISLVAIAIVALLGYGLSSSAVVYQLSVGPSEIDTSYEVERQSGVAFSLFNRVLVFSDSSTYAISSPGYANESVTFERQSDQRFFAIELIPLPGYLDVVVTQEFPVSILIDDNLRTHLEKIELEHGRHVITVLRGNTELVKYAVDIEGFGNLQEVLVDLSAYQALLNVTVIPRSATIELDDTTLGQGRFDGGVPAISGQLRIQAPDYDSKIIDITLERGESLDLGTIELTPSLITTTIETTPSNASVLLDGSFVGESTVSFPLRPGRSYELAVRKPGFREHNAVLTPEIGKNISQKIDFEQNTIQVDIQVSPSATVLVNGIHIGAAPLTLDVYPGDVVEAQSEGLTSQSKIVSAEHGSSQSIVFELLEPSAHAYHFAPERVTVTGGLELVRFPPVSYLKSISSDTSESMPIELTRPFYLGVTEVTIDAYRLFQTTVQGSGKHPITEITWTEAVAYCNWLSAQHNLQPFYRINAHNVIDGIDVSSLGFRLPTEAEWETGAAFDWRANLVLEPFEWGKSPTIPIGFGNLAGREASTVRSRYFEDFMDNNETVAQVASYLPNANGLHDLTGNVSEWVHDYYQIRRVTNGGPDYVGPETGFANVMKGSNYETHEIDEVATSFRDFETGKRSTLGFRIARWIY